MNACLIGIFTESILAEDEIKKIIAGVQGFSDVVSVSSIYKKKDLRLQQFWSVIKVESALSLNVVAENLSGLNQTESHLVLLAFNNEVQMDPSLTLPHPLLSEEFIVGLCSSEVWGQYQHPILNKTLFEIYQTIDRHQGVEFHVQSNKLFETSRRRSSTN